MKSPLKADVRLDSEDDTGEWRLQRTLWRIHGFFRCSHLAVVSLITCLPLLVARRPRTPLRVLCIGAFEYLARLDGRKLDRAVRMALAYACDFGALRNDFYDQRDFDRRFYRDLRRGLCRLAPPAETRRYILELRKAERGRPIFGPDGFPEPRAVVEYRNNVLEVSLVWLQAISGRSLEPGLFQAVVALVALIQLVDDLIDWKDDFSCRRPTYVTAFLHELAGPPNEAIGHIRLHANRFRGMLAAASVGRLDAVPLALAGGIVWLVAILLMRIRFAE